MMKLKYWFSILLFLLSTKVVLAQRCGGGIYEVKIYSINGVKINNLQFEVYDINADYLSKINSADNTDKKYCQDCIQVDNMTNHEIYFIKHINKIIVHKSEFIEDRKLFKNEFQGTVSKGIIPFNTRETYHKLYLLKVYDNKTAIYLIDNFMGGCNYELKILWDYPPKVVYN